MESEDGCPLFPGFREEGGCSSPKFLGEAERGVWVGSATGGARRRREDEQSGRGIIARQLKCAIGGTGGVVM
jgi:hypothetical protein